MLKGLPTIAIVTTVAVAIWVVAEAESVRVEAVQTVVAIESAGSEGYIARPDPGALWTGRVTVTAEGSAGAIDRLKQAMQSGITLAPGRGLRLEAGSYAVLLRETLSGLESIRDSGATISAVDPPSLVVEIAEQDSARVPIELDARGMSLESAPAIRPPHVVVTGPRALIARLTPESRAVVRLSEDDLRRRIPGQAETITDVRVALPAEIAASDWWGGAPLSPATVDVTITVRAQVRSITFASVGVLLCVAPVDYNDWDVLVAEHSRYLRDVMLTGPSDVIGQFERGERRLDGLVRLSFQDMEAGVAAGTITREAQLGPLPPGVTAVCEDTRVELGIRRRERASPDDPPASERE